MPLSLGLRMGLSAGSSLFGWVPTVENSSAAVAFDGANFVLPAYGPELVTTGTFDASTGWNIGSLVDWSISGGTLNKTGTSASGGPTFTLASQLTAGTLYRVTYRVVSVTVGGVGVRTSGSWFSTLTNRLSAGTYEEYITPVSGVTGIQVVASAAGVTCVVDDLSVREVMLGEMGANLGASGYTMSVNGGTGTATESPSGQLNLTGDGTNPATGDKQLTGLTVGAHYRIVWLSATQVPTVSVGTTQGGTQTVPATAQAAVGVGSMEFTATATSHWVRFARTPATLSTITSITVAQWTPRPTLRTATFSEVFAFTASSTTARTYVGADGLIKNDLSADVPRVDYSNGRARFLFENQSTNLVLWSRDLTNAAWTKSNMTTAQTATGADGGANSATTLTATAGNATALQAITSASSARITGCRIRRRTGSGTVELTQDNGTTWTPVTVTTSWTRVSIASVTSTNPTVGIRIVTSGDAVDVDYFQHEAQAFLSADIPTTSATVTRLIETPRFSPLVEAIFALPGISARVQGRTLQLAATAGDRRVIGTNGTTNASLIGLTSTDGASMNTWNGSAALFGTFGSGSADTGGYGVAVAANSSGRSVAGNGGSAGTDTNRVAAATQFWLARGATVGAGTTYTDGYYSSFALYPFRATNANVSAIAVAPT
jgi:hypothetical protein